MSNQNVSSIKVQVSDISSTPVEFLLAKLVLSNLSSPEFIIKTKLNEEHLRILNLVLSKCPQVINEMGTHVKKIVSDQVVNSADIPEIILLVQLVLNTHVGELNKLKVTREQIITFVKNIFVILIEADLIKTTPESKQACLALLDLSIKLLESKVNVQKVVKCRLF